MLCFRSRVLKELKKILSCFVWNTSVQKLFSNMIAQYFSLLICKHHTHTTVKLKAGIPNNRIICDNIIYNAAEESLIFLWPSSFSYISQT